MRIFPTNFQLALDSREMSVSSLAKNSGMSYRKLKRYSSVIRSGYMSWVNGHEITEEELVCIGKWLRYPPHFFTESPIERYPVYFCGHGWV